MIMVIITSSEYGVYNTILKQNRNKAYIQWSCPEGNEERGS